MNLPVGNPTQPAPEKDKTLQEVESEYIKMVYDKYNKNKCLTARVLGIGRATIFRKLKKYKIG